MISRTQEDIIRKWPKQWELPTVSIRCITYNQEPYIAQALDGFLMQDTDFPFEVVVHDDASTDRTADIIREYERNYPKIVKPIYEKENLYIKQNKLFNKIVNDACRGKYIALCEGDDYWIDTLKLQKQINFLEKNPDYGFVYTNVKGFNQKKQSFFDMKVNGLSGNIYVPMLKGEIGIWTLTFCCRKELYLSRPDLDPKKYFCGDRLTFLHLSSISKGLYISDITAVYRELISSVSHFTSKKAAVKFKYLHNHTSLLYLKNGPDFKEKDIRIKEKSIGMISYCFYYYDWDAFKQIDISFFPIKFKNTYWTIKYFVATFLYKLCEIKPFFNLACYFVNKFGKK